MIVFIFEFLCVTQYYYLVQYITFQFKDKADEFTAPISPPTFMCLLYFGLCKL